MRSPDFLLRCSLPSALRRLGYVLTPALILAATGCDNDPQAPEPTSLPTAPALTAASLTVLSFRQVSAGALHTCGVTTDDVAYCWGLNSKGQLGDGTTVQQRERPVKVAGTHRFRLVSAGDYHTCALTTDNRAYCWGWNMRGALGIGTTQQAARRPLAVATDRRFRNLSAGWFHTCAVNFADRTFCWGYNAQGQIGDGTRLDRWTPRRVAGGLSFRTVAAGTDHTCGVTPADQAYCWGGNEHGDLGDGSTTMARLVPTAVAGGHSFSQLAAGDRHSCGVTTANAAYCWGWNLYSQLGDGTNTDRRRPRAVAASPIYSSVTAGGHHSCGLELAQSLSCWGHNSFGQLGNGTFADQSKPLPVYGDFQWKSVDAGSSHTCAVTTDDRAYCWGYGGNGQIGSGGTSAHNPWPVAVLGPS